MSALNNDASSSPSSQPPPSNPILTAYENFVDKTSLITRSILSAQFVSYLASWFVNPSYALSNSLYFTVQHYEVYRLITSPLVNTSIFSLVFAFVSFLDVGKRLEFGMGSAAFLWLCLMLSFATNLLFLFVCTILYYLTNNSEVWLLASAHGIWLILFGIISMDCIRQHEYDPSSSRRFLFNASIPTKYYPIALYVIFALLNQDMSIGYLVSIVLGYCLGMENNRALPFSSYIRNAFLINNVRVQQWEETTLRQLTTRPGWVTGTNASGVTVSSSSSSGGGGGGGGGGGIMGLPLFQQSATGAEGGGDAIASTATTTLDSAGGGRTLGGGGATHRRAADTRAARLQALEQRSTNNQQSTNKNKNAGSSSKEQQDDAY